MVAGMITLFLFQQSGVMGDLLDYIEFGETNVIECDKIYSWYDDKHLTADWTETDQAMFDYAKMVCK